MIVTGCLCSRPSLNLCFRCLFSGVCVCVRERLRAVSDVVGWVLSSRLTYFRTSHQLSAVYRLSWAENVDPVTKKRSPNAESRALLFHSIWGFFSWSRVFYGYFSMYPTLQWLFRGLFMVRRAHSWLEMRGADEGKSEVWTCL